MALFTPHSWNAHVWEVTNSEHSQKLPGWLFAGPGGVGKFDCALTLAAARLCSNNSGGQAACGNCRQCLLFAAGTHPDFHLLTSERSFDEANETMRPALRYIQQPQAIKKRKPRAVISVDQIRNLIDNIVTSAQVSQEKVIIIYPADCLNTNAANALLKALEEPPANTTFVLVSSRPWKLPPTVSSRVSKVRFAVPDKQMAMDWLTHNFPRLDKQTLEDALAESGGSPLFAQNLLQAGESGTQSQTEQQFISLLQRQIDPLIAAKTWQGRRLLKLLDELQSLISSIVKSASYQMSGGATTDRKQALAPLAASIPTDRLFTMFDILGRRKSLLGTGVDETLLLEEICIDLAALAPKRPKRPKR